MTGLVIIQDPELVLIAKSVKCVEVKLMVLSKLLILNSRIVSNLVELCAIMIISLLEMPSAKISSKIGSVILIGWENTNPLGSQRSKGDNLNPGIVSSGNSLLSFFNEFIIVKVIS